MLYYRLRLTTRGSVPRCTTGDTRYKLDLQATRRVVPTTMVIRTLGHIYFNALRKYIYIRL